MKVSDVAQTGRVAARHLPLALPVCGSPGADPAVAPRGGVNSAAGPNPPGVVPGPVSPQRGPGRRQDREHPVRCEEHRTHWTWRHDGRCGR